MLDVSVMAEGLAVGAGRGNGVKAPKGGTENVPEKVRFNIALAL